MIVLNQSAELIWATPNALQIIERAGRVAYKSEGKVTEDSATRFTDMLIQRGHESVIEHALASIYFTTDRGVSHELVRHRLFSFTQESTRYCNYSRDKFGNQISVITPPGLSPDNYRRWLFAMDTAEREYLAMLEHGATPQIARSVLPTCLKTEIVVTGNFRQWRLFLKLRTAKAAHPQMQELAGMAQKALNNVCPVIFPI